jgi:peroxiredoxin
MAMHKEDLDVSRWVEDRLETLTPGRDWNPRADALDQLRSAAARTGGRRRRRRWATAAATTLGLCVIASPAGRTFAERCVTACVDGSNRIGQLFWSRNVSSTAATTPPIPARDRLLAPDFELPARSGVPVGPSHERGRVVLLNFWATWCPPCVAETASFVELQRRLAERGLSIIGVSADDDGWTSVDGFVKQHHVNYPVVIGGDAVMTQYSVANLPTTLLIDRNGAVAAAHVGVVDQHVLEREIDQLLDETRR